MKSLRHVPVASLRTEAWANGAGSTTVIASGPHETNWQWRLSIADITQDCTFSTYPGTRRQIVTLDAPLHLQFGDGRNIELLRLASTHFDGADAPQASLPQGATRAFNVMLRSGAHGEMIARPLNGNMWLPVRPQSCWFAHLLGGRADIRVDDGREALEPAQSIWIDAEPGERVRIEGAGELVLVQLAVTH